MTTRRSIDPAAAVLWASAFVLAGLVILQAGRLPGNPAYAGMAVADGGYSLVTGRSGRGPNDKPYEVLYVIDSRGELLLAYEVENVNNKAIVMRGGQSLPLWFQTARR